MYKHKSILAIIPARGGSKGLLNKNIKVFSGKPMIGWTVLEAKKSKYIDRLILSSDDARIIRIAKSFGCPAPFVRPAVLSGDRAKMADVVLHAIKQVPGYDYIILLQPTSPLRSAYDIDNCIKKCVEREAKACVSVCDTKITPYWMFRSDEKGYIYPFVDKKIRYSRRQDIPKIYALNGAIYCAETKWFIRERSFISPETLGYIMPDERSLDIDTAFDFKVGQMLMKVRNNTKGEKR